MEEVVETIFQSMSNVKKTPEKFHVLPLRRFGRFPGKSNVYKYLISTIPKLNLTVYSYGLSV